MTNVNKELTTELSSEYSYNLKRNTFSSLSCIYYISKIPITQRTDFTNFNTVQRSNTLFKNTTIQL
jgi:hypothetical protein